MTPFPNSYQKKSIVNVILIICHHFYQYIKDCSDFSLFDETEEVTCICDEFGSVYDDNKKDMCLSFKYSQI